MSYVFTAQSYNIRSLWQIFTKICDVKITEFWHHTDTTLAFAMSTFLCTIWNIWEIIFYLHMSQKFFFFFERTTFPNGHFAGKQHRCPNKCCWTECFHRGNHVFSDWMLNGTTLSVRLPAGGLGPVWRQLQSVVSPSLRWRHGRDGWERGLRLCRVFADGWT